MKITQQELDELRQCEIYNQLAPRQKRVIEWLFKEYIDQTNKEETIETDVYIITKDPNLSSVKLIPTGKRLIRRRQLLNLDLLDFSYGIAFPNDDFMPFFGTNETGLFSNWRDVEVLENGDVCLVRHRLMGRTFLVTKEETGYFELDCSYLGTIEECELLGILENIETR